VTEFRRIDHAMRNTAQSIPTRREFLAASGLAVGTSCLPTSRSSACLLSRKRPRVAAIFTEFYYRSHAHVILENFLEQYLFNGQLTDPGVDVVSFYADQLPEREMSREVARKYKIPMFPTIDKALCMGGDKLAVDAVLSIGEHGNYPANALGQKLYPRKRFFDEIVAVMKRSQRFVPVFNDKHLSTSWLEAKAMFDEAQQLGIPLMAGSSVPLAERRQPLEFPLGTEFQEAVVVHGGQVESYDFHGLELLQSMIEVRSGGETGIESVEFLAGDEVWRAADQRRWSLDLAEAAMKAEFGRPLPSLKQLADESPVQPHAILLKYHDRLRAAILRIGKTPIRWNFACRRAGRHEIEATSFYVGPWINRNLFGALAHAIQNHFQQGQSPYPVERTLMVSGVLEAAMRSRKLGAVVPTPELEWSYAPQDFKAMREFGSSWEILTEDIPQPPGVDPLGAAKKRLL